MLETVNLLQDYDYYSYIDWYTHTLSNSIVYFLYLQQ